MAGFEVTPEGGTVPHAGHLQPEAVYSFAFAVDRQPYQTFYHVQTGG
jgi:hypothetical protein